MFNFYLVCGLIGSGKSTLSERIVANNPNIKLYDVDIYYKLINGNERIHKKCALVWKTLYKDIESSVLKGEDILLTTSALTISERYTFLSWTPKYNHHLLWVNSPIEKCLEGNRNRYRVVPEPKLLQDYERMQVPNENENGWTSITYITNCWDNENYMVSLLRDNITQLIKI